MSLPPQAPPFSPPSSMIECLVQGGLRASGPRRYVRRAVQGAPGVGTGPPPFSRQTGEDTRHILCHVEEERRGGKKNRRRRKSSHINVRLIGRLAWERYRGGGVPDPLPPSHVLYIPILFIHMCPNS